MLRDFIEGYRAVREVDHIEQTFEIKVRSLRGVPQDILKRIIEQKFEVTSLEETSKNFHEVVRT
jgi:hypothetical protein